jgi:signal transduction histidine kinase
LRLSDLQQVNVGAWIAVIALSLALAFILARSRNWAQRKVRQATRDLEALGAFHRAILAETSLEKVLEQLTHAIAPGMGFQSARVYLLNKQARTFETQDQSLSLTNQPELLQTAFGAERVETQGLILLPLADTTPAGAVAQCWQAPETRCTVQPRASMDNRKTQCPSCENFSVLGVLSVSHFGRLPRGATRLHDYADATALALRNARLYESQLQERGKAQRKASELELIYEVGSQVRRAQDERGALERVTDRLMTVLGASHVQVALLEHERVYTVLERDAHGSTWSASGVPASEALQSVTFSATARTEGNTTIVPMLLFSSGGMRTLGAVAVTHPERAPEVSLLTTVAAQTALALHNISELEALRLRERESSALAELGRRFAAPFNRDPQSSLRQLCEAIRAYTGAACFITTLEMGSSVHTRIIASSFGANLEYAPGEDNLTVAAMTTRMPVLVPNTLESPRTTAEGAAFGAAAVLTVPLLSGDRFVGALHAVRPDGFGTEDATKFERLGQQVALVLDNLELLRSLQVESERLEDVLENLAEGVIVLEGPGGESLIPEVAQTAMPGLGRANAAARTLLNLPERFTHSQLPAQVRASLEQESSSLTLGRRRLQVLTKRAEGRTVVVLQDVSAFEAVERAKAEFLGVVSHELRTPLTAITGFTELMLSGAVGALSPEQDQFLNTTLIASKNLHQTVQNLLIASNLEAGSFELHARVMRLNLRKSLERFRVMASEKDLRLKLELPEAGRVNLDAERISLVLENLVSNAVRYTPSGGEIEVRVTLNADALEATVSDSGGGLRPDQEARLFEKFTRDARNTQEGAGIALYVSRAIVRACGGRLWAQNHPGQGLTMHLRVPILEPAEDTAASDTPRSTRA